jgi:hypothetical protein
VRAALGDDEKQLIQTVSKRGYKLVLRPQGGADAASLCARGEASLAMWTPESMRFAWSCFNSVCTVAPGNARSLAGRAVARATLCCWGARDARASLEGVRRDAEAATEHAPLLAAGWLALAAVDFLERADMAGVDASLARCIELDSGWAVSRLWRALILSAAAKFDRAIEEARCAVHMEPLAESVRAVLVQTLFLSRRYQSCVTEADSALELFPGALGILAHKGLALLFAGAEAEALRVMSLSWRAGAGRVERLDDLAKAFETGGVSAYFEALANITSSDHDRDIVRPVDRASLWAMAGYSARAMAALELAAARADPRLRWVGVLPQLDSLRSLPAFGALCAIHAPFGG